MSVVDNLPNDLLTPYNPNGGYDGSGINPSYLKLGGSEAEKRHLTSAKDSKPFNQLNKTHIIIAALIVVVVIGYFVYQKYWK